MSNSQRWRNALFPTKNNLNSSKYALNIEYIHTKKLFKYLIRLDPILSSFFNATSNLSYEQESTKNLIGTSKCCRITTLIADQDAKKA